MTTELIWQHLDAPGWEHVRIIDDHPGWTVFDSILVRKHEDQVLRGGYTLVTDKQWRTLELRLMLESAPGAMEGIHLLTEGDGRWTDANDQHIPELDGCLDVDIEWTPLTSSLLISHTRLQAGEDHSASVIHISMPTMSMQRVTKDFRRLDDRRVTLTSEKDSGGRSLLLDRDGFLQEIPGRFLRSGAN